MMQGNSRTYLLFIIALLTLPCTVRAQKPDAGPAVTEIQRIDIVASWGGFGPTQYAHTVIQRIGDHFAVDDRPVETAQVEALISALFAEPQQGPSPNLITKQLREYDVDYFAKENLKQCIGVGADLSGPRSLFERLFYDDRNQRRWIADEYDSRNLHTDDYPAEQVTVTFKDGSTVGASSASQKLLMLPFEVTRDGRTYATFDERVPQALAALTVGGVNSYRIKGGESLFSSYGDWLCEAFRKQLSFAALTSWAPRVAKFITSHGVVTNDFRLTDDLSELYARLHFPEWPKGVTYQVLISSKPLDASSITAIGLPMLREAKERGDAIVSLPWVRSWLRDSQKPSMLLESFAGGSNSLDWPTTVAELKSNSPIAYAAVTHNLHAVIQGMMWAGKENEPASRWLFLPNGNAVELNSGRAKMLDRQGREPNQ